MFALPMQIHPRLWIRLLLVVSTFYGFWLSYEMNSYRPLRVNLVGSTLDTLVAHLGLWVATFKISSRWRFLATPTFFISMVGLFFIWGKLGILPLLSALGGASWLFFRFLKGEALGD